ncbi:hypothetical protein AB0873_26095 [Micromonospora sp. NPDC047707]|uniref:IS1096 element passenger TnpR family protein n=1 Tax=Micromonospora sp. NPDC047707 TaxID=3154498 RepID=UPI003456FEA4
MELFGGGMAGDLWPRPGRVFAVSPQHTFHTFAEAIDDAFARWDRSHLHIFELWELGKTVTEMRFWDDPAPEKDVDADTVTIGELLKPGDQFGYIFDLGDRWKHQCVIADQDIDPVETLGILPAKPLPYWGWGTIPDPYGRLFDGDDGESPFPDPPKRWPWDGNAPDAEIITEHSPGQWTRTYALTRDLTDDDPE